MTNRLLSQLVSIEILTPKLDESIWFFKDVLGLYEVARKGRSVYFKGWQEWYTYSLKLTESETNGIKEITWRADSEDDLYKAAKIIESKGLGLGWDEGEPDLGVGKGFRFILPSGQIGKIVWDMKISRPIGELRTTAIKVRGKKPLNGIKAKDLSHTLVFAHNEESLLNSVNLLKSLGFKVNEYVKDGNKPLAYFMTVCGSSHDIAVALDSHGIPGRLSHLTYFVEYVTDVLTAADIYTEYGLEVIGGPLRHPVSGDTISTYVREPGGNIIEVTHGGYWNFVPDWEPLVWDIKEDTNWLTTWGHLRELVFEGTPIPPNKIETELKEIIRQKLNVNI
ncbi:catechol 1,2-dioxygenase [Sulfolobus sp. A20]|uniref:VOC family protein n=1 Tax=Sulfolobaceae TaxID=118883 RepID=UPI000845EE11|nr:MULTISPECIES: VOC family protein [unclassified Sulfolobus]TRM73894.1 catechol 2,3-dioxygenase [Sulfolobus sp. E5]TRM76201.1 catechol 2,3-dioxygenase [Sulfolobus sp. A20-N-F8]TRM79088.1 catechol 2,3-dioxygenase [Sulfolobus sp. B5]TRM81748.1 catechol 2,3-dioxygenase [Sulfolobus sp. D5]TRM83273.1 catechol 2,3-dioxygenase [Sulfolobus sp. A20-N-F6]TRM85287.1 catechol 2,3-dioxygenase [Sulfolobus sp. F3]TRN01798.1 catechol 2,3-dioxygenase [Sulfolobus sp. F1]TRN01884.1 catechol 2,3-dioxygenase [